MSVLLQPTRLPFGSKIIYDIMTQVFLGDSNRSIAHHWWGLCYPQPIVPLYTVALAATYVSSQLPPHFSKLLINSSGCILRGQTV